MRYGILLIAAALLAAGARGQSSAEVNAGTDYNFGSPGARSLGVGGAFIGIADDATAAYTNPAGLLNITRPQFAAEGRGWSFTNFYSDHGHAFGPPTGQGVDNTSGISQASTTRNAGNLSFASFVYPRRRWSVGFYRHDLAHFRASAETQGIFLNLPGEGPVPIRFFPSRSNLDLSVVSHGASLAVGITDSLFAGVTLTRQWLRLDSVTTRYAIDNGKLYEPPSYANVVNVQEQHGRDTQYAMNAGLLWAATSRFTLGLIYRQGSSFAVDVSSKAIDGTKLDKRGRFSIPSVFGLGMAYRPAEDGLTILSVDIDRVGYSRLTKGFAALFGETKAYRVDDGTEIHVGFERLLLSLNPKSYRGSHPVSVRLGTWLEPDHRLRYTDPNDPQAVLFRPGKAQYHVSGGFGVGLARNYGLDGAYDYSRGQRVISLSLAASY